MPRAAGAYERSTWLVTPATTDRPRSIRYGRGWQTSERAPSVAPFMLPRWSAFAGCWGLPPRGSRWRCPPWGRGRRGGRGRPGRPTSDVEATEVCGLLELLGDVVEQARC